MLILYTLQVSKVDPGTPQEEAKKALVEKIDTYIQVRLSFPCLLGRRERTYIRVAQLHELSLGFELVWHGAGEDCLCR